MQAGWKSAPKSALRENIRGPAPMVMRLALLAIGMTLLMVNMIGVLGKHISTPTPQHGMFKNDVTLDYSRALDQIEKLDNETIEQYIERVTYSVSKAIAHYWPRDNPKENNLWIPATENYLLHVMGYIKPKNINHTNSPIIEKH